MDEQNTTAGWKLVPVEPTDKMVQAAHHLDLSYMPGQEGADRAAIYRAMLAAAPQQPALQPVAWLDAFGEPHRDREDAGDAARPLYAAPQQPAPQPLTDEQIAEVYAKWADTPGSSFADLMRAVEGAHGIKEQP